MQEPFMPPKQEHKMICPNCGSHNVALDESNEVKNSHNEKLVQYSCGDCHASFIPAMKESKNDAVSKWANKVRQSEGLNEGKSWSQPPAEFIIIIPKDKN